MSYLDKLYSLGFRLGAAHEQLGKELTRIVPDLDIEEVTPKEIEQTCKKFNVSACKLVEDFLKQIKLLESEFNQLMPPKDLKGVHKAFRRVLNCSRKGQVHLHRYLYDHKLLHLNRFASFAEIKMQRETDRFSVACKKKSA